MSLNEIDLKISNLVKAINSYPGLVTLMSCGGHQNPKIGHSQVPKNQFYIEFKFMMQPPTPEAWASFQSISELTDEDTKYDWFIKPKHWVKIEVCGSNKFLLHGKNVEPDELAKMVNREISR